MKRRTTLSILIAMVLLVVTSFVVYAAFTVEEPFAGDVGYHKIENQTLDRDVSNAISFTEPGEEKGMERKQYPKVFASVDFYRKDLLAKDGELNYNNVYEYDDKIAKKAGYKEKLNDSTQTMDPKIRELKARTTALSNIGKYIVAATGVALGAQKSFEDPFKLLNEDLSSLKLTKVPVLKLLKNIGSTFVEAGKTLWKGTNRNLLTKHGGKALILASIIATINTWLIPTKGFKTNPNTMKSTVDTNKEFEVC